MDVGDYSFGDEVRQVRIRKGLSLEQVSHALRINVDILRALEADDFGHLPAEGFIRNQVSAYARYLGMDSSDATSRFLREYHRHMRRGDRGSGRDRSGGRSGNARGSRSSGSRDFRRRSGEDGTRPESRESGRNTSRGRRGVPSPAEARRGGRGASRSAAYGEGGKQLGGGYDSRSPDVRRSQRQANSAARRQNESEKARKRTIVIGLFMLLALIALVWTAIAANCSSANVEAAPNVPNTGLEEVSAQRESESVAAEAASVSTARAQAAAGVKKMVITVPEGSATWVEATIDGVTQVSQDVTGPMTYTFEVTAGADIVFGTPGQATVSVDGQTAQMTEENGIEKLTVTAGPSAQTSTSTTVQDETSAASSGNGSND